MGASASAAEDRAVRDLVLVQQGLLTSEAQASVDADELKKSVAKKRADVKRLLGAGEKARAREALRAQRAFEKKLIETERLMETMEMQRHEVSRMITAHKSSGAQTSFARNAATLALAPQNDPAVAQRTAQLLADCNQSMAQTAQVWTAAATEAGETEAALDAELERLAAAHARETMQAYGWSASVPAPAPVVPAAPPARVRPRPAPTAPEPFLHSF